MIKAIIFDIGGVLVNKSPVLDEILEEFNLKRGEIYDYYFKHLREHEVGEISEVEFWNLFKKRFNLTGSIPKPSPMIKRYQKEIKINSEVSNTVNELKEAGYKLAALSNTIPAHADHLTKLNVFKPFEVIVLSNEVRLLKPDPRIYKLTLEKLNVEPEEALFIDDVEEYVEAAKKLGINSLLFTTTVNLRKGLQTLGITIGSEKE